MSAPASVTPVASRVRDPVDEARSPFRIESVPVGDGHVLHVEHWGCPEGLSVLVLHGGPGSGASPVQRRAFDAGRFHVVMPDQRGAGRSQPGGSLVANTTAALVDDVERLRRRLGIERWALAGGSWGATLALAVAAAAPERVVALLLRNPFLGRRQDVDRFFAAPMPGDGEVLAAAWSDVCTVAPADDRGRVLPALALPLTADDALAGPADRPAARAALAWWRWEAARGGHDPRVLPAPDAPGLEALVRRYRVQAHYLTNELFLGPEGVAPLLPRVPAVPTWLLQGQRDGICPPEGAQWLHRGLPGSTLVCVDGAGHDPTHPSMADAMHQAVDALASTFDRARP